MDFGRLFKSRNCFSDISKSCVFLNFVKCFYKLWGDRRKSHKGEILVGVEGKHNGAIDWPGGVQIGCQGHLE